MNPNCNNRSDIQAHFLNKRREVERRGYTPRCDNKEYKDIQEERLQKLKIEKDQKCNILVNKRGIEELLTDSSCTKCITDCFHEKIKLHIDKFRQIIDESKSRDEIEYKYKMFCGTIRKNKKREKEAIENSGKYNCELTSCGIATSCTATCNCGTRQIQNTRMERENK